LEFGNSKATQAHKTARRAQPAAGAAAQTCERTRDRQPQVRERRARSRQQDVEAVDLLAQVHGEGLRGAAARQLAQALARLFLVEQWRDLGGWFGVWWSVVVVVVVGFFW